MIKYPVITVFERPRCEQIYSAFIRIYSLLTNLVTTCSYLTAAARYPSLTLFLKCSNQCSNYGFVPTKKEKSLRRNATPSKQRSECASIRLGRKPILFYQRRLIWRLLPFFLPSLQYFIGMRANKVMLDAFAKACSRAMKAAGAARPTQSCVCLLRLAQQLPGKLECPVSIAAEALNKLYDPLGLHPPCVRGTMVASCTFPLVNRRHCTTFAASQSDEPVVAFCHFATSRTIGVSQSWLQSPLA